MYSFSLLQNIESFKYLIYFTRLEHTKSRFQTFKKMLTNSDSIDIFSTSIAYNFTIVSMSIKKTNNSYYPPYIKSVYSLKAIMIQVGHNEPRTTLAIYTHITDKMQSQLNKALNNIGKAVSLK